MLNINRQITLVKLQKVFLTFSKENLLISIVMALLFAILGFNLWFLANSKTPSPPQSLIASSNLAEPTRSFGEVLSTATQSAIPSAQEAVSQIVGKVSIAVLGDSMIDTMADLKNLKLTLTQYYPKVEFVLLNYGVGATTPENGLARLTQSTQTPSKNLQPLLLVKPDIVVIESFGYNHGRNTQGDIDTHYQTIKAITESLKRSNIAVLFLTTIAPTTNYAKDAPGILWDENRQKLEAQTVIEYLKAGLKFAKDNNLILIDGFTPSLDKDGFGKQIYVNSQDNIHPSQEGNEFISDLIAQKITQEKLVEKIVTQ